MNFNTKSLIIVFIILVFTTLSVIILSNFKFKIEKFIPMDLLSFRTETFRNLYKQDCKNFSSNEKEEKIFVLTICQENSSDFEIKTQINQVVNLIKSAVVLTSKFLRFLILTDDKTLFSKIMDKITKLFEGSPYIDKFTTSHKELLYPKELKSLKKEFKPCATARLFISDLLSYDSVVYLDTDILFLRPPEDIWKIFHRFKENEFAAMGPTLGFYNLYLDLKFPYYGETGLNDGVILMNLSRIREFRDGWTNSLFKIYQKYKKDLILIDQDIFNIFFYEHPETLHELGCDWNFCGIFCETNLVRCERAQKFGVSLLHGNGNSFYSRLHPQVVFESWQNFTINSTLENFLENLEENLSQIEESECVLIKNYRSILTKNLKILIKKNKYSAAKFWETFVPFSIFK